MNNPVFKTENYSLAEQYHFRFEEDFMEDNIRCIPMIVRFKLDAAGIKLKLAEWSSFTAEERCRLTVMECDGNIDTDVYRNLLQLLVKKHTGHEATALDVDNNPPWANLDEVHPSLQLKAAEHRWFISIQQWRSLSNLQRFALLKLYRPGHENKNFPKAMKEFELA